MDASCLCGAVRWNVDGPLDFVTHCHCGRCRKTHGAAFVTLGVVPVAAFHLDGVDSVTRWQSSTDLVRCFCRHCGSSVPGDAWEGAVFVPLGNFEADPGARPLAHIFVASKAAWHQITDDLPQYEAYPPGIDTPVVPDDGLISIPGLASGSCLCGAVTFELRGPATRCNNCHCGRCRKARSAAYATNLIAPLDALHFTRGADRLVLYKVPEAHYFSQAFCRDCGSILPRVDQQRRISIAPLSAFDGDPGLRPERHTFVASKAPWFELTDALPRFAEAQT